MKGHTLVSGSWNCSCGAKAKNNAEAQKHFLSAGAITKKQVEETEKLNKTLGVGLSVGLNKLV